MRDDAVEDTPCARHRPRSKQQATQGGRPPTHRCVSALHTRQPHDANMHGSRRSGLGFGARSSPAPAGEGVGGHRRPTKSLVRVSASAQCRSASFVKGSSRDPPTTDAGKLRERCRQPSTPSPKPEIGRLRQTAQHHDTATACALHLTRPTAPSASAGLWSASCGPHVPRLGGGGHLI